MPKNRLDLILLTSDLFFASKFQGSASLCGLQLKIIQQLPEGKEFPPHSNLIIDLQSPHLQFEELTQFLHTTSLKAIGYAPHVKSDLIESGTKSGIDQIYSRGEISRNLNTILNDLALPES